jgi:hypothetical protein
MHLSVSCARVTMTSYTDTPHLRLPEMAGGWGSALQKDEKDFYLLDGM